MKTPTTIQEAADIAIDYLYEEMRLWKEDHDRGDNAEVRELFVVGKAVEMATPLFQTAPDLLAALEELMRDIKGYEERTGILQFAPSVKHARAAIAKAQPTSAA